jgi:hypothetical protein
MANIEEEVRLMKVLHEILLPLKIYLLLSECTSWSVVPGVSFHGMYTLFVCRIYHVRECKILPLWCPAVVPVKEEEHLPLFFLIKS